MSIPRQIVLDYREATENLLKLEELTDAEIEVVQDMVGRLSEKFNSDHDGDT